MFLKVRCLGVVMLLLSGLSYSVVDSGIVIGGKNSGPDARLLTANYCLTSNFSNTVPSNVVTQNYSFEVSINAGVSVNNMFVRDVLSAGALYVAGHDAVLGYTLFVQALTSSPADSATTYFGALPRAPSTTAATNKIYIQKPGTIRIAEIYCYSGTAGTAEAWSLYIRLNNTTDTLISTVTLANKERIFRNTGLNLAVVAGDYIEIKSVQPLWGTNPLTTIYGGYLFID